MKQPTEFNKENIKGIEAKHITYVPHQNGKNEDMHLVKEIIHFKDGTKTSRVRPWFNYKRNFWVTAPGRRNHKEKKDYEYESHCVKYSVTQIEMPRAIQKVLNDYSLGPNPRLRQLARSPYLYGADISSSSCLKNDYQTMYPGLVSLNTVSGGDIETNVIDRDKDGQIICMSVCHKKDAFLCYLKEWVSDINDPIQATYDEMQKIPELVELQKTRPFNLEVMVVNKPSEIVVECIRRLHKWKPDFFAFWNIDYDLPKMLKALKDDDVDPALVFSDPSVPKEYRYFHYKRGQEMMTTASGVTKSKGPEEQWHWVTAPASFQCIDSMATYYNVRRAKGREPSYRLEYILQKEIKAGKLNIPEASHLDGIEWHRYMQKNHKIAYGIYNVIDSIRLEQLDEKTNDLALAISMFSKTSDYANFSSNPKRLCDDMHFWYLRQDPPKVIATSSDQMVAEIDKWVVGTGQWIVTLATYLAAWDGLKFIKDFPDYATNISSYVADLDNNCPFRL